LISTQTIQFEALEWAWLVTRYAETKDESSDKIQEMLFELGNGVRVNFSEKTKEIKAERAQR